MACCNQDWNHLAVQVGPRWFAVHKQHDVAVARARAHFARHTAPLSTGAAATGLPAPLRAGLEAAAQLSEDALARGVLLTGLAAWLHGRLAELEPGERVLEIGNAKLAVGKSALMPPSPDLESKPEVVAELVKKIRSYKK